mmetsp:Transcript_64938/g.79481  ORF Transcript_64938/g.79481 Transcript_64938/m.79481 type:complete len:194 (+) Transcript_64938:57-638(+)
MERKEGEAQSSMPPWMSAAQDMGVTFAPAEQPPWLLAAVEQGVVFYDPEGREIKVPASQVPAFNEALSKVRDFEETWQSAGGFDQNRGNQETDEAEEEGIRAESTSQRQDLKAFVQKIYFKLLREGVEPNDAAAQAIRQAAGQQGQEHGQEQQEQQGQTVDTVAPAPLAGQKSCSLSASGKSGPTGKEVTVFA